MKRFLSVLLVLVLLAACSVSFSEDIDLSGYSIEDLLVLKTRIDEELIVRNYVQPWFSYGIGAHIPVITLASGEAPALRTLWINDENQMRLFAENVELEDFENYTEFMAASGFTINREQMFMMFRGENEEGYRVEMTYFSSSTTLYITAYKTSKK